MASRSSSSSHETLGHFNQVRDSSSSLCNNKSRGFSTAQMCLKRILEIISSIPPRQSSEEEEEEEEEEEDKGGLSHPKEQELEPEVELDKDQRNAEFGSETSSFKKKAHGGSSSSSSSSSSRDCLDLLVEAAKLISGNNTDDEEELKKKKKRRKEDWMVTKGLYGEGSAVVRSKRGRSQALPSRLRDSVLEPWLRLPPSPLRSTQTTPTRRRRRRSS